MMFADMIFAVRKSMFDLQLCNAKFQVFSIHPLLFSFQITSIYGSKRKISQKAFQRDGQKL